MCIPLRSIERTDPLARTLAVPPPLRLTFLVPAGWRALPTRLPAPIFPRPAAAFGRAAGVLPRLIVVFPWLAGVVPWLPVVVFPRLIVVFPWFAGVVPRLGVVFPWLPVVFPREGVEACDCVAGREGALAGALLCGAALGADSFFWPQAKAGTAIKSTTTSHLCNISSPLKMRFITASWLTRTFHRPSFSKHHAPSEVAGSSLLCLLQRTIFADFAHVVKLLSKNGGKVRRARLTQLRTRRH